MQEHRHLITHTSIEKRMLSLPRFRNRTFEAPRLAIPGDQHMSQAGRRAMEADVRYAMGGHGRNYPVTGVGPGQFHLRQVFNMWTLGDKQNSCRGRKAGDAGLPRCDQDTLLCILANVHGDAVPGVVHITCEVPQGRGLLWLRVRGFVVRPRY